MYAPMLSLSHDGTSISENPSPNATPTSEGCANGLCECGKFDMTEHIVDWAYHTQALAVSWYIKAGFAAVATWLSTEPVLLYCLVGTLCLDFIFGLYEAVRRNKFSCRMLKRGGVKFPAYCLYIGLIGCVDTCVEIAFHTSWPILELAIAYFVAQECVSIMGHMMRLGVPVPSMIRRILLHGKKKVEKHIDDMLDVDETSDKSDNNSTKQ